MAFSSASIVVFLRLDRELGFSTPTNVFLFGLRYSRPLRAASFMSLRFGYLVGSGFRRCQTTAKPKRRRGKFGDSLFLTLEDLSEAAKRVFPLTTTFFLLSSSQSQSSLHVSDPESRTIALRRRSSEFELHISRPSLLHCLLSSLLHDQLVVINAHRTPLLLLPIVYHLQPRA